MLFDLLFGLATIFMAGAGLSSSVSISLKVFRYLSLFCSLLTDVDMLLFSYTYSDSYSTAVSPLMVTLLFLDFRGSIMIEQLFLSIFFKLLKLSCNSSSNSS